MIGILLNYLEFKPDTENKDHLKVDGEKFTILFYENTQSVEISTTHSGVDELFRYAFSYRVRSVLIRYGDNKGLLLWSIVSHFHYLEYLMLFYRYLKNYKFPIGIRSVNLAIIPKIDKPEKIDHKKPIKDVESDEE